MAVKNNEYLFGKIPEEWRCDSEHFCKPGVNAEYYFRFLIDWDMQEVKFEDTCDRMVPISFEHLCEMRDTMTLMINHIATSTVGANYEVS